MTNDDLKLLEKHLDIDIDLAGMEACPYSDAELAEEIRVWMEKANNSRLNMKYAIKIRDYHNFTELDVEVTSSIGWIFFGLQTTPIDKINAFLEVMKGMDNE